MILGRSSILSGYFVLFCCIWSIYCVSDRFPEIGHFCLFEVLCTETVTCRAIELKMRLNLNVLTFYFVVLPGEC